jgi:ring-1,2-phenylacetyl-CoA epoxidase subunit PaaC
VSALAEVYAPTAEAIATSGAQAAPEVAMYALGLADDALLLSHRTSEWVAWAPELEEDVALANIALDLLGHARSLLTYAGTAWGKTEDDLAYFRDEHEFRCRQFFEAPRGDFAYTVVRSLIASVYFDATYAGLRRSSDPVLAAVATKAGKETAYHLDHAIQWSFRLGLGTEVSRAKLEAALLEIAPLADELFAEDPAVGVLVDAGLDQVAVDPRDLREDCFGRVVRVLADAGLAWPEVPAQRGGGRRGVHSEAGGFLLAELQVLARQHPGARW